MIRESNRRNPCPNKHAIGAHALEMQFIKGKTSTNRVTQTYPHDDVMRLDKMSWTVNGEVFAISQTYDALDRLDTIAYPDVPGLGRTTVQHVYNAFGEVQRIDDVSPEQAAKTLWEVKARNRDGALLASVTGDGFTTRQQFDDATGQLEDIRVHRSNGVDAYHVGMGYDDVGHLATRTDYVMQREEQFKHDDLSRLTSWKLSAPGESDETFYRYDRASNLEKVTRGAIVEQSYTHGNEGRPHAIARDTLTQEDYGYDGRGRLVNGGGRSITYSDFDLPTQITTLSGQTSFAYDASNQRITRTSLDEQTVYIGGLYERRTSAQGSVHVFHIGGIADIVVDPNALIPRETLYLHTDALGSTSLVTDAEGNTRERPFYAPFGARIDIRGNPPTGPPSYVRNGFTGHRHDDELGLIDMRGRIFDTKTSRFPTPDPIVANAAFSPSLNRYGYVYQSPLNWVDPTGFDAEELYRNLNVWGGSVFGGDVTRLSSPVGGNVDPGLLADVTAGIAGMPFPAGSDAVNTSGCPKGRGTAPGPCTGASQGGCPSGNAITDSWGFRFAKGMAVEKVKGVGKGWVRINAAVLTLGASEMGLAAYSGLTAASEGYEQSGVFGAGVGVVNQANPIYAMGMAGVGLYNAVDEGDPEKIGRAALPVAEAIIGAVVAGKMAMGGRVPEHHIATVKNTTSSARGGPWTPRFEDIFTRAGMGMEDAANKVRVPGHKGPHPEAYHQFVFDRLHRVTRGLSTIEAEAALRGELATLRGQILTEGSFLNRLVTRK